MLQIFVNLAEDKQSAEPFALRLEPQVVPVVPVVHLSDQLADSYRRASSLPLTQGLPNHIKRRAQENHRD